MFGSGKGTLFGIQATVNATGFNPVTMSYNAGKTRVRRTVDTQLLFNVVRHVDAHNKVHWLLRAVYLFCHFFFSSSYSIVSIYFLFLSLPSMGMNRSYYGLLRYVKKRRCGRSTYWKKKPKKSTKEKNLIGERSVESAHRSAPWISLMPALLVDSRAVMAVAPISVELTSREMLLVVGSANCVTRSRETHNVGAMQVCVCCVEYLEKSYTLRRAIP
jgi:hypothetical protein